MPELSRRMKRRRFVTLVAMSGAASPAIRKEISNQEKSLGDQLKTIRGYALPPGSPMAFAFKPLRARRGAKP
jgi:hypothetical protein